MSVSLKAGENYVVYTGQAQSAEAALASIMPYLTIAYYFNNYTALYEQVITTTIMVPYGVYWVEVTQDCTWNYGAEEPAPSSVQLYSRGYYNLVAYSGPAQPVEDAIASIWDYLLGILYFDNAAKLWVSVTYGHIMVPNGVYAVWVSQNCRWYFVEPFKGTISKKELEYNESRGDIPVSNVPQDKRGLVHIWGRNDMSINQKLGIYWIVTDPDDIVIEEYSDWQAFSTAPGAEHEFIAGRFDLDKVGTYSIQVGLLMNPADPLYVDIYYGDLCTVAAAVPEPQFRGFGVTEYAKV